jgi:hypothetical protein
MIRCVLQACVEGSWLSGACWGAVCHRCMFRNSVCCATISAYVAPLVHNPQFVQVEHPHYAHIIDNKLMDMVRYCL